jgi:hypothetical protein
MTMMFSKRMEAANLHRDSDDLALRFVNATAKTFNSQCKHKNME